MNRIAGRTKITIFIAVMLMAGLIFFCAQYVSNASQWVVFPGSPHVYNGGNIGTGTVVDRNGVILMDLQNGRQYAQSDTLRKATVHWLGDREGRVYAPALSHYAAQMSGYHLITGLYHYADEHGVARLTMDARVQKAALEALGDKNGTVGVFNYQTGEIICAVTSPTFDPDHIPDLNKSKAEQLEGIYFNRFTQGTYIPGSIFKIVTLAAALEEDPSIADREFSCSGALKFGPDSITCENAHGHQSLKQAFRNSCNCAFAQIAIELGPQKLAEYAEKFGVFAPLKFDGISTQKGNFDISNVSEVSLGWAGIGQYTDTVNPCAFMRFTGAIAADGLAADPYMVQKISMGKSETYAAERKTGTRILSSRTAGILREYLRFNVADKYGDQNFPGLQVGAKTGTGEVGGDKKPNAMLAGFVENTDLPLAFIVCVEDGGYGSKACIPVASKVLSACLEGR